VGGSQIAEFHSGGLGITGNITGNGASLSGITAFSNIAITGGNAVVADSISDTLTLIAGDGISLIGNATADSITIALTGSGDSIFVTGGDMGTVTEAVTQEQDLGLIIDVVTIEIDMGTIVTSGVIYPDQLVIPSFTVAQLANLSATPAAQMVYCTDESGGAVPAFSDGTNWRRVTDRAIVS
jgi:SpoU rRNA methylase family enzyme